MGQVVQAGSINVSALSVPDMIVQVLAPSVANLNGVPTNLIGTVGVASWGPANSPVYFSSPQSAVAAWGPQTIRNYDLTTFAAVAQLQQANNFVGIRVTDGSDIQASAKSGSGNLYAYSAALVAAGSGYAANDTITLTGGTGTQVVITVDAVSSGKITAFHISTVGAYSVAPANPVSQGTTSGSGTGAKFNLILNYVAATSQLLFLAKYTGVVGNGVQVITSAGSKTNTGKVVVSMPGQVPEIFDNIAGSGNALYVAMANAINNGIANIRGPSNYITAVAGSSSAALVGATYNLSGGTDGDTGVGSSQLIGVDGSPRTGMYALRGTKASIIGIPELGDSTTWTVQQSFGQSPDMGAYMVTCLPASTAIATAIAAKNSAGLDTNAVKVMHGDWPYYNDLTNGLIRLVSPIGYVCGLLANLSPEQSSLNKPILGVVSTQTVSANQVYSDGDLSQLISAGIDVITNPNPGGNYYGCRLGVNASSNTATREDPYTRLTNYIAYTIAQAGGKFVGLLQTPTEQLDAKTCLINFLQGMQDNGMIDAFSVQLDVTNNPPSSQQAGYQIATVAVRYFSVIRYFIVNLQGGQTVQVTVANTPNG